MGWSSHHVLSYQVFYHDSAYPPLIDKMLNSMALPRMSWMFLSCLMLLSQVQGKVSLLPEQNSM